MNKPKINRRELALFLIVAFAVPYLMGIPLAFAQRPDRIPACLPMRR